MLLKQPNLQVLHPFCCRASSLRGHIQAITLPLLLCPSRTAPPDKRGNKLPAPLCARRNFVCAYDSYCVYIPTHERGFQAGTRPPRLVYVCVRVCRCVVGGQPVLVCTHARAMMLSGRPANVSNRFRVFMVSEEKDMPLSDWPPCGETDRKLSFY